MAAGPADGPLLAHCTWNVMIILESQGGCAGIVTIKYGRMSTTCSRPHCPRHYYASPRGPLLLGILRTASSQTLEKASATHRPTVTYVLHLVQACHRRREAPCSDSVFQPSGSRSAPTAIPEAVCGAIAVGVAGDCSNNTGLSSYTFMMRLRAVLMPSPSPEAAPELFHSRKICRWTLINALYGTGSRPDL